MPRPKGWGDQFLLNYLYDSVESIKAGQQPNNDDVINALHARIEGLEAEIARLDTVKANRAGRKKV